MAEYPHPGGLPYVAPILTDDGSVLAMITGKATLVTGKTYVYPLGGNAATVESVHIQWDANAALTITVEDSNFAPADVTMYSTTTGDWLNENPSTAYVATVGAGAAVASATVTVTAGNTGGALYHLGNTGAKRTRLKIVATTGGVVRVACHGKA